MSKYKVTRLIKYSRKCCIKWALQVGSRKTQRNICIKHKAAISVFIVIRPISYTNLSRGISCSNTRLWKYQCSVNTVGSKSYWFELITLIITALCNLSSTPNSCRFKHAIPSSGCLASTQRARWTYSYKNTAHLSSIKLEKHQSTI